VPHPTIVTESGCAIAAYHSVLVFNVLGVSGMGESDVPAEVSPDAEQPLIPRGAPLWVRLFAGSARSGNVGKSVDSPLAR
jgi:arginine decarboxylase-like protein